MTLDDYLAARMISTPLCLFDCDAPCDGSTAVVVSHADYAPDAPHPACHVNAMGTALRGRPSWDQFDDMTTMSARDAAASMWERTELQPADVDVAELYDGFSILTMVWLEELGFCGRGESGPFVEGGARIALDGALPLNTAGASCRPAGCTASGCCTRRACSCGARAATARSRAGPRWPPWRTGAAPSPAACSSPAAPADSSACQNPEPVRRGSGPTPSTPTASRRSARDGRRHPPNSSDRAAIA